MNVIKEDTLSKLKLAKLASCKLSCFSEVEKNQALELILEELINSKNEILQANEKDLETGKSNNLSSALLDRLLINDKRFLSMCNTIKKIVAQKDPTNQIIKSWVHPKGMKMEKITVPLGVICVIYEARPNVTVDSVALCLKSGNAIILRGSQHAYFTNLSLVTAIKKGLAKSKLNPDVLQFIESKNREESLKILQAKEYVDLIIPRGGEELKSFVLKNTQIPVIGAGGGICHLFIDESANIQKALNIANNAKTQRPGVCNAVETILVHRNIAHEFLPKLKKIFDEKNVEIFGCNQIKDILKNISLTEKWDVEYLDLKVSIKMVDSIDEAINHINQYGTLHSESIITENKANAKQFQNEINSACIYVNASTRFTDGEEFEFGAEIGISTQKLHARGPIGLNELVTYKYLISGDGQVRS